MLSQMCDDSNNKAVKLKQVFRLGVLEIQCTVVFKIREDGLSEACN